MSTALDLSLEHGAGITVVHCRGEIDLDSRYRLASCLRGLAGKVEVDLSGVTFLDSSGISTLVTAHNALLDAGGKLRLCNPQHNVRAVLDMVGLSDWVD
jgi:anti-anti-sigma factor